MPKIDIWNQLTAQSQAAVHKSRELAASFKPGANAPLQQAREGYLNERRYWNSFAAPLHSVQDLRADLPQGAVKLRLYKPSDAPLLPVLLYAHGGGYILGNLDSHDRICRLLAQKSGWAVLAIDYALAPEKKFPTQCDQMLGVLRHVAAHAASLGLDAARIAVGGDSAGAHLSLGLALDARAPTEHGAARLCAQLLYYGGYGLKDSMSRRLYGWSDLDGLGDEDSTAFRSNYLARPEDADHPRNNLLKADMASLPPSFIAAVAYDPLRDDSLALAEFFKERGVPHRLEIYQGVLHAFLHYSALEPIAMQALEDGAAFLRGL